MREVGLLVWVVLLIIGVTGSMISSLRKQAQRPAQVRRPPRPMPPTAAPAAPGEFPTWLQRMVKVDVPQAASAPPPAPVPQKRPLPASVAEPAREPVATHGSARGRLTRELFGNRNGVVRAVIAAEVFGKPRGLGDEYPKG